MNATFNAAVTLNGTADQELNAGTSTLTLGNTVTKTGAGGLTLAGATGVGVTGNLAVNNGSLTVDNTLTAGGDVTKSVYLGRPWRPYASVVFLNTEMGEHIDPAGWREWHPGETHSIETVFYAEFNSTGPGARPEQRDTHTHLLTPEQARQYEPSVFLGGSDHWNPQKNEKSEPATSTVEKRGAGREAGRGRSCSPSA